MFSNIKSNGNRATLLETIESKNVLSTFAQLLNASAVAEIFKEERQFTVFAPTNEAFDKISDEQMEALVSEKDLFGLKRLLTYHILPTRRTAAAISGLRSTDTVAGPDVRFSDRYGLKVNDSTLGLRNIEALNGVIHIIDKVLLPPPSVAVVPAGSLL